MIVDRIQKLVGFLLFNREQKHKKIRNDKNLIIYSFLITLCFDINKTIRNSCYSHIYQHLSLNNFHNKLFQSQINFETIFNIDDEMKTIGLGVHT